MMWETFFTAAVVGLAMLLMSYYLVIRVQPGRRKMRPAGLSIIHTPTEIESPQGPQFEIVAVHGLGAHPDHTWEGKPADGDRPRTHFLKNLLRSDFPTARILSFAYNSDWLVDAPETTAQQIGESLLQELESHRHDSQRLPIIFIGHSFGGIVIKQALCSSSDQHSTLLDDTCGIIFLGTPHGGSSFSTAAALLSQLTGLFGSNDTLLLNLRHHHSHLSSLEDSFRTRVRGKQVFSFYETKPTYFLGLSVGCIVDKESARGSSVKHDDMDTNHVGLNKFDSASNPGYRKLKAAIEELRAKSPLERADEHIRKMHYTDEILRIERLSGDPLSLDQCYINLAIIEQMHAGAHARDHSAGGDSMPSTSPFSLLARQKVEIPETQSQIPLMNIFDQRKGPDNALFSPRRILIRGRAGVGKTTLCKKMVHDFLKKGMWSERFDRVLWIPLRNLRQPAYSGFDLKGLFDHELFRFAGQDKKDGSTCFSKELFQALTHDRTLFILDGWDEVAGTDENDDIFPLLRELLNQPRAIITSRPSAVFSNRVRVDLELETIGFNPAQVHEYIHKVHGKNMDELETFLRSHELVRGLVRIPIQLDAFCYCWDDFDDRCTGDFYTMTTLYQAIQTCLWRKDLIRLEKMAGEQRIAKSALVGASQESLEDHVEHELRFLEHLAFAGLAADIIEFGQKDRNSVHKYTSSGFFLAETLPRLSFLRTSNPSAKLEHQLYHFIHLTFQEFFAARFFVRHWVEKQHMEYTILGQKQSRDVSPLKFLQEHKYDARYDVMWRFVAGLLDNSGQAQVTRLFEEIEKEPVDLLGPTHQRLVMHCLSEAMCLPCWFREGAERRLAEWMIFEIDYTGSSMLAREPELPDTVLSDALRGCDNKEAIPAALAMSGRNLSDSIIASLMELLKSKDRGVRRSTIKALGNKSTQSDTAEATLVKLLKNRDSGTQTTATFTLKMKSALSNAAVADLVELLKHEDGDTRYHAAEVLSGNLTLLDATIDTLVELLKHDNSSTQYYAAQALGNQQTLSGAAIAAIVELLKHDNRSTRYSAAKALGSQPTLSGAAVAALVELLEHEDSSVQKLAARILSDQVLLSETVESSLVELLKCKESEISIRNHAVKVLSRTSILSDATVATLVALLKDDYSHLQLTATRALGNQPTLSGAAVAILVELLEHKDSPIEGFAARALGNQPTLPGATIDTLVELLKHDNSSTRYFAAKALGNQPTLPGATIDTLVELLKHDDSSTQYFAAKALGNQRTLSGAAIAAIVELLKHDNSSTRYSAAQALGNQRTLSGAAVDTLVELLKHNDSSTQYFAAKALGNQRTLSGAAVAALVELLKHDNSSTRHSAAQALGNQRTLSGAAVAALVELLEHEDSSVRNYAAQAVGSTPPLIIRLIEVIGLSTQSQSQAPNENVTLRHIQYIEPLYQCLLWQGFNQQSSLYMSNKDDNLLILNQSSGLRTAFLGHNEKNAFKASIISGRRGLQGAYSCSIWRPLGDTPVDRSS